MSRLTNRLVSLWLLVVCFGCVRIATAQGETYVKSHYTKYEYRISMRDGVHLFTAVYVPKDASPQKRYPILLTRTPYGVAPYGADQYLNLLGPDESFGLEGFVFAYQDVRGTNASEGKFVDVRPEVENKRGSNKIDESSDTYDTVDWLVKHIANNNGKVGLWGVSYPGFYAAAGAIDAHPAVVCVSPQAPVSDWFMGDDFHHNGALYLAHAFNFFSTFGVPRPVPVLPKHDFTNRGFDYGTEDGYQFYLNLGPLKNANEKYFKNNVEFWNEMMRHGTYDSFWRARNLRSHLKNIKPAVLNVGGWFDAEDLFGALHVYKSIESSSPYAYNVLVMGPWYHGAWTTGEGDSLGSVQFNSKTGEYFREKVELPFFLHFLKGAPDPGLAEATVFETGSNQWRRFDSWPPHGTETKSLYLHPNGKLSFAPPADSDSNTFDEYISDPQKPVPYIAGIAIGMTKEHMVDDQRFAARRNDVLTYTSDVLAHDLTLAGPVAPIIHVATTGTDSDFVVKLIDVYPADYPDPQPNPLHLQLGGFEQLLRGEIFRGKFRNGFSKPEPFVPGEITQISYVMPDVLHTFRTGHRIMVQIQSSWFPLVDRNPQTFVDIYNAKESDFQKATERIYTSKETPSRIDVQVLPSTSLQ